MSVVIDQWSASVDELADDATLEIFQRLDALGYSSVTWASLRAVGALVKESEPSVLAEYQVAGKDMASGWQFYEPVGSDIFLPDESCLLHVAVQRMRGFSQLLGSGCSVTVTAIHKAGDSLPPIVDAFLQHAGELIRELSNGDSDINFRAITTDDAACMKWLGDLPGMVRASEPTGGELKAALEMISEDVRSLILRIKAKNPAYLDDFIGPKGGQSGSASLDGGDIARLEERELLVRDTVIVCSKTSKPLKRIQRDHQQQDMGETCPHCQQPIADERMMAGVRTTEMCNWLFDKNRWMLTLAVTSLLNAGVKLEQIVVPPTDSHDDPIDLAYCYDGMTHLVELKGDDFQVGDAGPFGARLLQSKAQRGVIACTGTVADEARTILDGMCKAESASLIGPKPQYFVLEGSRCITSRLVSHVRLSRVAAALNKVHLHGAAAGIDPYPILVKKLGL